MQINLVSSGPIIEKRAALESSCTKEKGIPARSVIVIGILKVNAKAMLVRIS